MATFFGEVIYPSSRVFFDEYDDSDDENETTFQNRPKLILKKHCDDSLSEYDAIIISEGQVANGFTEASMLKKTDKILAEFELTREEGPLSDIVIVKPKTVPSTKLYLLPNKCLLLQVSPSIDVAAANQLTLLASPWLIKCKKVIIVASRHNASFRCDSINDLPSAFVRALSTSAYPFPAALKHLEQPNFLSDFPASVLSWCEAQAKLALLIILYSDQSYVDSVTLDPVSKAFSQAGLSSYILNETFASPNRSNTLKDLDKTFMYM